MQEGRGVTYGHRLSGYREPVSLAGHTGYRCAEGTGPHGAEPMSRYAVVFTVDGNGLLWIDRATGDVKRLSTYISGSSFPVAISPSGRYAALGAGST